MGKPRGRGRRLYEVELLDTKINRTVQRGRHYGRYPLAAQRAFAKTLPKSINLRELRTPTSKYSRYVLLAGLVKKRG